MIELMLVVAIIGILAGLSVGYSGSFQREENLKETARAVQQCFATARAEAVRQNTKTAVNIGRVIYAFIDANGNYVYDAGERVLMQYPQPTGAITNQLPITQTLTAANLLLTNPVGAMTAIFDYQGFSIDYQGNPVSAVVCVKDSGMVGSPRSLNLTVAGSSRIQGHAAALVQCP